MESNHYYTVNIGTPAANDNRHFANDNYFRTTSGEYLIVLRNGTTKIIGSPATESFRRW